MTFKYLISAFCLCFVFSAVYADDLSSNEKNLSQLQQDISKLKKTLKQQQKKQNTAQKALQQSEEDIAANRKNQRNLDQKIKKNEAQINQLNAQKRDQQSSLLQQQDEIEELILIAWKHSKQSKLKLLLEDPAQSQRLMDYFDFFTQQQIAQLQHWHTQQVALDATQNELTVKLAELKKAKTDNQSRAQKLLTLKQQRNDLLQQNKASTKNTQAKIDAQIAAQQQVQRLINNLQEIEKNRQARAQQEREAALALAKKNKQQADIAAALEAKEAKRLSELKKVKFSSQKGTLNWPVQGNITQKFNQSLAGGAVRSAGIVIKTSRAEDITVLQSGLVLFSGFIKGLGNLVVVDHGNDYMSLYSRNEANFVSEGEQVSKGDVIGLTGSTGGSGENITSLYLEIRHNGQAVNPMTWLK
jgi:murein hydrolase activator